MNASAVAAKNAPVVAPILAAGGGIAIHSDILVTVGAVVIGLFFGAMWRTGSFLSEGKSWTEIRSDLVISLLIGGANAILTMALVDWLNLGMLLTMALGAIIGATGLRALPELKDALMGAARRRLLQDGVVSIMPPEPEDVTAKARAIDAELKGKQGPL